MSLDFDSARLPNEFESQEHQEWRKQLRRFFDKEVMPYAETWDDNGDIPDELWHKSAAMGILGLGYPEEYGGTSEGIDIWHKNILIEELARIGVGGVVVRLIASTRGRGTAVRFPGHHTG